MPLANSPTSTLVIFLLAGACAAGAQTTTLEEQFPGTLELQVSAEGEGTRDDAVIDLSVARLEALARDFNASACVVLIAGEEVASQPVDSDGDGRADRIICVADLPAGSAVPVTVRFAATGSVSRDYPKRTQAELSHKVGGAFVKGETRHVYEGGTWQNVERLEVPPEHTDHSFYIRYEGPGWESDRVGYRFYLDWRNAVDIFGKLTSEMVLQDVGIDGFDSYHEPADWGLDIFKVGDSLGIGSIGMWHGDRAVRVAETDAVTCTIRENGPVLSSLHTRYDGWRVGDVTTDLDATFSIAAGSRMTRVKLTVDGPVPNLCTGLAKYDGTEFWTSPEDRDGEWAYIAQWGPQTLTPENDALGIAVLFPKSQLKALTEDELNHVVVLDADDGGVGYGFLAAWAREPGGVDTIDAFKAELDAVLDRLDYPVEVTYGGSGD